LILDADHDNGRDVRTAARADQRAEMELEIGAELEPSVRMRDCDRAFDVVLDRLARGVGQVVDRQNDDVIAYAYPPVLAAVSHESLLHDVLLR
jgi:hypothetical protein